MWLVLTLISGFFTAAYYWGNQLVKLNPFVFMFYRGFVPVVVLLPLLPFVHFIDDWHFYALCLLQGSVIAFIDYGNFVAMNKWGTKVVSALRPLSFVLVFAFWTILRPAQFISYLHNPFYLSIIFLSFAGIVYAASSFSFSSDTKKIMLFLFPFLVMSAVCDILNKLCMSYVAEQQVIYASYLYILITASVVAMINFVVYLRQGHHPRDLYTAQNLKYALLFLLLIGAMISKNFAMFSTSNPSFVTAGLYSYILWIFASAPLLRLFKIKTDYVSLPLYRIFILLFSVVLLVFL